MRFVTKLAVAAAVAIVVGAVAWTGAPWGGQPAFAEVLQKVQRVRSVRFKSEGTTTAPGATKPTTSILTTLIVGTACGRRVPTGDSSTSLTSMPARR